MVLELNQMEQSFELGEFNEKPILSFNREFSAPVLVDGLDNINDKAVLFINDTDTFNRWDSGQELFANAIINNAKSDDNIINIIADGIQAMLGSDLTMRTNRYV